jgi:hypothetical protein
VPPSTTGTADVTVDVPVDVTVPTALTAAPDTVPTALVAAGTTEPVATRVVPWSALPAPATTVAAAGTGALPA